MAYFGLFIAFANQNIFDRFYPESACQASEINIRLFKLKKIELSETFEPSFQIYRTPKKISSGV
jgi:hypothetical protein